MGAQSLVIGKMFGEGFQYGKRKISAMPNEEFNKLTFEKMMSNAREEIKASIPTMAQAMQDMKPLVDVIIREFLQYINEISKTLQDVTVTGIDEAAHLVGTHIGHAPPVATTTQTTETPIITEEGTLAPPPVEFPSNTTVTRDTPIPAKTMWIQFTTKGVTTIQSRTDWIISYNNMKNYRLQMETNLKKWIDSGKIITNFQKQQAFLALASYSQMLADWPKWNGNR